MGLLHMHAAAKISKSILPVLVPALLFVGCSRDSALKIRYDMEKLTYQAQKISEKINIQPRLATPADTIALAKAHQVILDYYFAHRDDQAVAENDSVRTDMARLAVRAQLQLARLHLASRKPQEAIAAYRRIGPELPVEPADAITANLELALTYRSQEMYDSTIAVYNRLLEQYYPPVDGRNRVYSDIAAIPIDRLKIVQATGTEDDVDRSVQQAVAYYARLRDDFPDHRELTRAALVNASRIYTMTARWDDALDVLRQITDSTGATDVSAIYMMANIYSGPRKQPEKAIQLYQSVIDREPDSTIIGNTMLRLGAALCAQEEYEDGRRVLADVKRKFAAYPGIAAPAQYYYAQSFDAQDRWERALSEFQWLMENHPYSEVSFKAALYIPRHFVSEQNDKLAEIWYERVERFFLDAARIRQGEPTELNAYLYLADLYGMQQKWNEALEILEKIYDLAPKSRLGAQAMYFAASVAYQGLGDSLRAKGYIGRIRQQFGTTDSTIVLEDEESDLNPESIE